MEHRNTEAEEAVKPSEWKPVDAGVIGDERHIGLWQISEGWRIAPGGAKQSGAMLSFDWIVGDEFFTAALLKCDDGRSAFIRNSTAHAMGRTAKTVFEFLDGPAYTSRDPILDAHSLAAGFAAGAIGRLQESAEEIVPLAQRFLADYYDPGVLATKVGRPITGRDYEFLMVNRSRRQLVEAMPWLLPYVSLNYGLGNVTDILRAVDGNEEIIPVLCKRFGVEPNVVRSMGIFPAWSPKDYRSGEALIIDAPTIALALSRIAPEHRPDKDRARRFMEVILWTETTLREAADQASRTLVAAASAEIWKRLRRRPYSLPAYHEVSWLSDMAEAVKQFPSVPAEAAEGTACGKTKSFYPHAWAVAYCLCRYHPTDLAAKGREWMRRETSYVRYHVRESFPSAFPITSYFPDSYQASNGWGVRRIDTVGELCDESAAASNCLAGYLASLIRRDYAVFRLVSPEGETEGHFSLESGEEGEMTVGQVKKYRNRKASAQMATAAQEFLALMKKEKGDFYPPPLHSKTAMKAGMRLAVTAVDGAKAIAHKKTVEEILTKAAEYFSINRTRENSR